MVIVTNGYRGVQPITAIKPGAKGDITLKGDETKSDAIAWSTKRGGPYIPTPVIYQDQLYILQGNGVVAAHDVRTGQRVYQERLVATGGSFSASPVAADGKLYFASEDGDMFVVKAGPNDELLGKQPIGGGDHGDTGDFRRPHHHPRSEARPRDRQVGAHNSSGSLSVPS